MLILTPFKEVPLYFVRPGASSPQSTLQKEITSDPGLKDLNTDRVILQNVMFKPVQGPTLVLHGVPLSMKVHELKRKLGEERGMRDEAEFSRYIWGGKQLEDGMPILPNKHACCLILSFATLLTTICVYREITSGLRID
jgi:hypothetical protein